MTEPRTAAFVGCVGGAGTTRLCVETAAALARAGRSAAVLDLDFATQGLAAYAPGDVRPDATDLLTDRADAADAFVDVAPEAPGRLTICPASAPFARVAAATASDAAQRLDDVVAAALATHDVLVLDVPPIVANQAIAGVTVADRVAAVTTPDDRGVDALARERGRLADVGSRVDLVVATRTGADAAPPDADLAVPTADLDSVRPSCLSDPSPLLPSVAAVAAALFDVDLQVEAGGPSVVDRVRDRLA